ncbi:MAG: segregation/condensation protein A [Filifactor alocis]|nr:segregation/condensation protein A [Filifactor alocis]
MSYELSTPFYEGPFDLLLELIDKQKINICDISIVEVTNQYIERINELQSMMDMQSMTEFLDMAVRLLDIKSRYLLYLQRESDEEEDPTEKIRQSLEVYKTYRMVAQYLREISVPIEHYYTRRPHEIYIDEYVDFSTLRVEDLYERAISVLERKNRNVTLISEKNKPLEERIEEIRAYTRDKQKVSFSELIREGGRDERVVTFLGILELSKFRQVRAIQKKCFGEITIERLELMDETEETV